MNRKAIIGFCTDNSDDVRLLKNVLEGLNLKNVVVELPNDTAIKTYFETDDTMIGLIVLNWNAQNIDSENTLKYIKSNTLLRRVPVVILGKNTTHEQISDCYRLGANCYIIKPGSEQDLKEILSSIVRFWLQVSILPIEEHLTV